MPSTPRRPARLPFALLLLACCAGAQAACTQGHVYLDANGNGRRDAGEVGIARVLVADGRNIATTDAQGAYRLPAARGSVFVVKPARYALPMRGNGLPDSWRSADAASCDFALRPAPVPASSTQVLVFTDPQPKNVVDVGYYRRDIVEPLLGRHHARLGLTLGDIVDDDQSLYPGVDAVTKRLGVPWLTVPGNHDVDRDATGDDDSLRTFTAHYGPDSYAWEEDGASFLVLDDVVYRPGGDLRYVGGLRADQFAFLEALLPRLRSDRLLVVAVHIPLFDAAPPGRPATFRPEDRERLFALLQRFPNVLVLSGHSHAQRQVLHGAADGWHGAAPLLEYNVGAACGAFWSGTKDAAGIPDATMSDGTPNGYATLDIARDGRYALAWHVARDPADPAMALHAPKVLRQGAYPAWGVYANVFMGREDTPVEYRVDDGAWQPMQHVLQPDPVLLAENARDDAADALRGYDRSPEATPSTHLWRGALPTTLAAGMHRVEVRARDPWRGWRQAATSYRLDVASP
ncbi:MAG: calcineurin phosphoesterase [Lysobacter sp.]|nr:calcineurin phosphoesterase [Lysobacter sp.]